MNAAVKMLNGGQEKNLGLSVEAENFLEKKILEILAKAKGEKAAEESKEDDVAEPVEVYK